MGEYHGEKEQGNLLGPFKAFLKKFTNIQTAELPITILLHFEPSEVVGLKEVLPDTLCKLVLRNDSGNVYEYERETLEFLVCVHNFVAKSDWRSIAPRLPHIYLQSLPLSHDASYWSEDEQNMRSACKTKGIDFGIIFDSLSPGFFISES